MRPPGSSRAPRDSSQAMHSIISTVLHRQLDTGVPHAGSRRGPICPMAGVLAVRERTGRAVLRCGKDGNGRRSCAPFGARAGAVGGTHGTGRPAPFRMLFSRGRVKDLLGPELVVRLDFPIEVAAFRW